MSILGAESIVFGVDEMNNDTSDAGCHGVSLSQYTARRDVYLQIIQNAWVELIPFLAIRFG